MKIKERDLRQALNVIIDGPATPIPHKKIEETVGVESFTIESAAVQSESKTWLETENVQGIGLGEKITEGKKTDDLSVRIYVEQKKPLNQLDQPIPKNMNIPAIGNVITDVIEIGKMETEIYTSKTRPAMPGCGVGHHAVSVGTFGSLVRKRGDHSRKFILSNSHVLAHSGLANIGDPILQPGKLDSGDTQNDVLASLSEFVEFDYSDSYVNLVDAAIAEIEDASLVHNYSRILGTPPTGTSERLRRGMKVQKVGRTTDHTWGEILDIDLRLSIPYLNPQNPANKINVYFRDQVLCTRYTAGGDSGAEVRTSRGNVVGLHFAGSAAASTFNKIGNVFDALDIELDI